MIIVEVPLRKIISPDSWPFPETFIRMLPSLTRKVQLTTSRSPRSSMSYCPSKALAASRAVVANKNNIPVKIVFCMPRTVATTRRPAISNR